MKNEPFMRAYTIQEVSKNINVPSGTIRQWEKDLQGVLIIPRTRQGSRFYTDREINLLIIIKQMREKNLSKEIIKTMLQKHLEENSATDSKIATSNIPAVAEREETALSQGPASMTAEEFLVAMDNYTQKMLTTINQEFRSIVRKELTEEVKKELSKSSLQTVKYLSDSIYKSSEKTRSELRDLNETINNVSELHSEAFETITDKVANVSKSSSEQIAFLSKRIWETSENTAGELRSLSNYVSLSTEVTNNEITGLTDQLNKDRDFFVEMIRSDRRHYLDEIKQRDEVLQELVGSFKQTAASKGKKSWKWWSK